MRITRDVLTAPNANRALIALSQPNTFRIVCDTGVAYISANGAAWTPITTGAVTSGWQRAAGVISEVTITDQVAIGAAAPPAAATKLYAQANIDPAGGDASLRVRGVLAQTGDLVRVEDSAGALLFSVRSNGNTVAGQDATATRDVLATRNVAAPGVVQSPSITRYVVDGIVRANVAALAAFTGVTGGTAVDGALFTAGARLLLRSQTTGAENGIYVVGAIVAGVAPLTRADDWAVGQIKRRSEQIWVEVNTGFASQNQNGGDNLSPWTLTTGPATVGTTATAFSCRDVIAGGGGGGSQQKSYTVTGVVTVNIANLAAFAVAAGSEGIAFAEFDAVLLVAQAAPAENGPYVVGTVVAGNAVLVRPPWFDTGRILNPGFSIRVGFGNVFRGTNWISRMTVNYLVGTTDPAFYPEKVTGRTQLAAGTFTINTVPIFSSTQSAVYLSRDVANTAALTTGGYHPTSGGATGISIGIIGVAAAIVEATVAAGTINNVDISTLHWTIVN